MDYCISSAMPHMSYAVSRLLASRMDAPIVGRRFIAGTNGAEKSESPGRDGCVGAGFQTCPCLGNPAKGRVSKLNRNSFFAIFPAMNYRATFSRPFGALAEPNK